MLTYPMNKLTSMEEAIHQYGKLFSLNILIVPILQAEPVSIDGWQTLMSLTCVTCNGLIGRC